jgi:mannose-6-phosphate isomerase-like protein (cupin superfamily)
MKERILVNPVTKEKVKVLAIAAETNGAYSMDEGLMLPGGANCLHYHRILTQSFTALEGPLHIYLGGKEIIRLKPNESYIIKPGIVHGMFNPTKDTVHYRVVTTPGHAGFENMLRILTGMADENRLNADGIPHDYATTALLMEMGDTYFMRTHTYLYPWLKWNANRARKRGIEHQLFKNYCTGW